MPDGLQMIVLPVILKPPELELIHRVGLPDTFVISAAVVPETFTN